MSSTNSGTTPTSGLAIACLVLGILTLVSFWFFYLALVPGSLAILLGVLGLRQIRRGTASGKSLAIAGIICAILGMIPTVLLTGGIVLALFFGEPVPPPAGSPPPPVVTEGDGPATAADVVVVPQDEGPSRKTDAGDGGPRTSPDERGAPGAPEPD